MPRCRVNGCANARAGHSRLCSKHKSRKRRHGHEEQRTVSKADLKPFVEKVQARIAKQPDARLWSICDQRWDVLQQYLQDAVQSGHLLELGKEFSMDALQRLLVRDGYGAQAKSVKEIGTALKAAGVLKGRASVNGRRTRVYHLPDWIAETNDLPEF